MSDDLVKRLRIDAGAYRQSLASPDTNDMFSLAYQWQDKKHRHVYDLCSRLETAADRIEKLEEQAHYANGVADLAMKHRDYAEQRVEKLEAALKQIIQEDALTGKTVFVGDFGKIARKALEGKDG